MNLKGTKTEENLMSAFSSESKNNNRYAYYAMIAKQEGYIKIAKTFEEISNQEKEHAKRMFTLLGGSTVFSNEGAIMSVFGSTEANLRAAIECERQENEDFYKNFSKEAKKENFFKIAKIFDSIAKAESEHGKIFYDLLKDLQNKELFKKSTPIEWKCLNCGYKSEELSDAPFICPSCDASQAYFDYLIKT